MNFFPANLLGEPGIVKPENQNYLKLGETVQITA